MENGKIKVQGRIIEISNAEKALYPKSKFTKGDVLDYYCAISDIMLTHLQNRPLSFHRYPNGIEYQHFVQQEVPHFFPKWMSRKKVVKENGYITHTICNDKKSLIYLASQAVLEFHTWLSRDDAVRNPDKMVFDLDPTSRSIEKLRKATLEMKIILENLGLQSYVMTSGSKGYHIAVPLDRKTDFRKVSELSKKIAKFAATQKKDIFTVQQRKGKRGNKIFIDYFKNNYAQTSIAPYSLRAIEGVPVATPLSWKEMNSKDIRPDKYNIKNIFRRIGQKGDPWKDIYKKGQSLKKIENHLKKAKI